MMMMTIFEKWLNDVEMFLAWIDQPKNKDTKYVFEISIMFWILMKKKKVRPNILVHVVAGILYDVHHYFDSCYPGYLD